MNAIYIMEYEYQRLYHKGAVGVRIRLQFTIMCGHRVVAPI